MSESVHIVSRMTRTLVLLQETAAIERELVKVTDARKTCDDAAAQPCDCRLAAREG